MNRLVYPFRQLLLVPAFATWLVSCTPTQFVRLQPVSGPVATVDGRLVTKASVDSVEVVASFEREDMEYLALDIEVKNRTQSPIDVNPADFQIDLLSADRQPLRLGDQVSIRQAADPNYELGRTDVKIRKEQRRLKTAKILNTVAMVAVVASDIASSSSRSTNRDFRSWASNRASHDAVYSLIQAKRVIDHGVFADRMQRFQFEEYRWRELALKRSVVQPGESVRGFVYLPKVKEATYLNVSYPVTSGTSVQLLFEQSLTNARPK
ncbi:hypothetical protein A6C57_19775 [Fibrella sp. ES10-3-2-2]|nr:hypothetical protein A6C57_19775 [Fibrella sp. ES10-3-2-2]